MNLVIKYPSIADTTQSSKFCIEARIENKSCEVLRNLDLMRSICFSLPFEVLTEVVKSNT